MSIGAGQACEKAGNEQFHVASSPSAARRPHPRSRRRPTCSHWLFPVCARRRGNAQVQPLVRSTMIRLLRQSYAKFLQRVHSAPPSDPAPGRNLSVHQFSSNMQAPSNHNKLLPWSSCKSYYLIRSNPIINTPTKYYTAVATSFRECLIR